MKHKSRWVIFYIIQLKIMNVSTQTYCMILFMHKAKNRKPHGIKNRLMVSRAQGGRKGGVIANKYELFIELMKKSWK